MDAEDALRTSDREHSDAGRTAVGRACVQVGTEDELAMILSDGSLLNLLPILIPEIQERDARHINPASVDIRIGREMLLEGQEVDPTWQSLEGWSPPPHPVYKKIDLTKYSKSSPFNMQPGAFALVSTFERLRVPNGYAVDLRLKSSRAREGWDHSLAFWFDPGWDGYGTMEIRNATRYHPLSLYAGLRFAQVIVHKLDAPAINPYAGRYQGASGVEAPKL